MERQEQTRIVEELLEAQRKALTTRLSQVPDNWDGIELRNWFADVALEGFRYRMDRKRARAYANDRIVHNL